MSPILLIVTGKREKALENTLKGLLTHYVKITLFSLCINVMCLVSMLYKNNAAIYPF